MLRAFNDEQSRTIVNLEQRYEVWMDARQALDKLPYDLRRKTVNGREYLYEIYDRGGNGKSLGSLDADKETCFSSYHEQKQDLKHRISASEERLSESCAMYRALRLPMLSSEAGAILREADMRSLLGRDLLIVGTNAIPAYQLEANAWIADIPDETEDFDMAWTSTEKPDDHEKPVWSMLKAVDKTYTINTERRFQARNAKAYEVELLVAPSRAELLGRLDVPKPIPLPEQEWLLLGRPISRVAVCRDGSPARLYVPDPRYFALHKLWMSKQEKRNPNKRSKDARQGKLLLDTVSEAMPHYPLDAAFVGTLPDELVVEFRNWKGR